MSRSLPDVVSLCSTELKSSAEDLTRFEEAIYTNVELVKLILAHSPNAAQDIDKTIQKLLFISELLDLAVSADKGGDHGPLSSFLENSLFKTTASKFSATG